MNNQTDIVKANINNLTSLWQKAAIPFDGYHQGDGFNYCYVKNLDWPNRLWFERMPTEDSIKAAKTLILSSSRTIVIPYWDIFDNIYSQLLTRGGFKEKSGQIGMSLELRERPEKNLRLQFTRVINDHNAKSWAEVYPKAFGYHIHEKILSASFDDIEFYIAFYNEQPVGTAICYQTGDIVGIHGVGIIPEMRRQGFAEEIMEFVLNRACCLKASYATLQASVMGKGLYSKLGFTEDFTLKNYTLEERY